MTADVPQATRETDTRAILRRARLPLVAAPMLIVSGPELVIAACRAGVFGSFPTVNCRADGELDAWLDRIERECAGTPGAAPCIPNLIVHRSNPRLESDLEVILRHGPAAVITSVGSPGVVAPALREAGIQVWCDVASLRHAQRAIDAGADGLILLTAGAGGQTGSANPFAFVRAVRQRFDGIVALSGGQADGRSLLAAQALGCDLGYMGTRFIATREANAAERYRELIVESELDDIHLTNALSGLETNLLRGSLLAQGLDPAEFGLGPKRFAMAALEGREGGAPQRWRDIWSAGHSVSGVRDVPTVAALVDRLAAEYSEAAAAVAAQALDALNAEEQQDRAAQPGAAR
ncbi:NAD(P)H-dependent flavin oxidoreductase [Streptomyces carpinensis]|uniref:Nitronate monooxygenase n=1 Tax=Streptomyces carpinensis TaxID=66369 RepID=A0ABV1WGV8_9ACTN|nr:nitronate monooxygenase [Streptomyces carpinensis]